MIRRPPALAREGMIAASHPLAAEAGASILGAGGHAVEAAVAAAAVLAVVEPSASGLGGDAFLLVYDREDGSVTAINGNGAAPAALTRDRFPGRMTIPLRDPLSATIPGCASAWEEAWYGWGRLEWGDLIEPAVRHAEEGFPVSWRLGRVLQRERELLSRDHGLTASFLHRDGSPLAAGEICQPRALARTLARLARDGAEALYEGEIAEKLVMGIQRAGGVMALSDLGDHETELLSPYELRLGPRREATGEPDQSDPGGSGLVLYEQPLSSQGILLCLLLALMDSMDREPRPWIEMHRQIQAARIALAIRDLFLTDKRLLPVTETELVETLLAPHTVARLARLLDEAPMPASQAAEITLTALEDSGPAARGLVARYREAGFFPTIGGASGTDTTYLCAVDRDGNVAGLIQSIFHPFGCGFLEPETGIILNNRASAFSLDPAHVNRLEPGKKTVHTLNSFLILKEGAPWLVGGTPGADHQIQTSLQTLRHLMAGRPRWEGPAPMVPGRWSQARRLSSERPPLPEPERLAAALEAPRWGLAGDRVSIEGRMPASVRHRMMKLGHELVRSGPWDGSGFFQAIRFLENGVCLGATDPRGEGVVIGL